MQTIEGYIHDLISHKFDKHVYCYYYNQEILYPFLCLRLEGKVVFSMTMFSSLADIWCEVVAFNFSIILS